ncbi:StbB family protein [Pseudomonas fragariae (ex Marin et al. 2024)]|uniref:StbB family protein n=1 Tax=Pseudomonas fragariae (ex Marin et al. 2024) TaxID=3080056 RepID=UPI003F799E9C
MSICAILNYTGTIGKTTIAAHCLLPRIPNAKFIGVESINETAASLGIEIEKLRGTAFRELFKKLMLADDVIIDIGASNIEEFMNNLIKFDGAHEDIDYFIVPVTSGIKEQTETIRMVDTLSALGVPADKIRIVFNRVTSEVNEEFPHIINYRNHAGTFTANPECAIYESELFDALSLKRISSTTIMEDETDYKALLKQKDATEEQRALWSDMYGLKLLTKGVSRNLDHVFKHLFL